MQRAAERRATLALGEPFSRPAEQQSGARAESGMLDMENTGCSISKSSKPMSFWGATVVCILIRSKCTTLKTCKLKRPAGGSTSSLNHLTALLLCHTQSQQQLSFDSGSVSSTVGFCHSPNYPNDHQLLISQSSVLFSDHIHRDLRKYMRGCLTGKKTV